MSEIQKYETAILGGGCFWCIEAFFDELLGVISVDPGYSGGHVKNPGYLEVCSGRTGHAEVVKISFDPSLIRYSEILDVFWHVHDPTTLNRQGNDRGTEYRSIVLVQNKEQEEIAKEVKSKIEKEGYWEGSIVTEIKTLEAFYPAEEKHQDYYKLNPDAPYCEMVIHPKLGKFREKYAQRLKKNR